MIHLRNGNMATGYTDGLDSLERRSDILGLRERNPEAAACGPWLKRQMTAIDLDRPVRYGETKAGAAVLAGARLVDAVEAVKDSGSQLSGNARTAVDHIDHDASL